jgi:hypothetical protein
MTLRAPKDTPARNAARTLTAGVVLALLILVSLDPALRLYDQHMLERPWVSATLTLVRSRERPAGAPDILYRVTTERQLVGLWSSWVETGRGTQCGRQGQALFDAGFDAQRWSWSGWFGVECPMPVGPVRVCIRYIVETRWQARDVAGPFCSDTYVPVAG